MKLTSRCLLAAAVAIASKGAWAADTYLNVFYGDNPLKGVEIRLDGQLLGKTNDLGSASGDIDGGQHTVELLRDGESMTSFTFVTAPDQDAEISVTFTDEDENPNIVVGKYRADDSSAGGVIGGVISDIEGNPIEGATVAVIDQGVETTTDSEGRYKLELARGSYSIEAFHPDFATTSISNVRILANVGLVASLKLPPRPEGVRETPRFKVDLASPIEEVLVLGSFKSSGDNTYELERFSTAVMDAIDVTQIERFGDSTAAAAVKRVVGVALIGGQYANVRGLDGRYISSTLNGFLMPSTDPMRRDIQLDLFPADILESIEIQKSYSADLPGTTTGGSIKMNTRGMPDDRIIKVSMSLGYLNDVTGEDIITYQESSTDWAGFDGGRRGLSDLVLDRTEQAQRLNVEDPCDSDRCISPIEAAALALTFEDDLAIETKTATPDFGLSLVYGDRFELGDGDLGFYSTAGYERETKSRIDGVLNDPNDKIGNSDRSKETISVSAYVAVGYEFNDADELFSKSMILRDTDNTTRFESGIDQEDRVFTDVILEWVERQFISQQFTGKHFINVGGQEHSLDWRAGFSQTDRYEPDRRTYEYLNGNLANSSVERRWSELVEDSIDIGFDYTAPFTISDYVTTQFKIGALISEKEREVDLYRFGMNLGANSDIVDFSNPDIEEILSYQNYVLDAVRLSVRTTPTDSYNSEEDLTAFYLQNETDLGEAWTLALGVRQQDFSQLIEYPVEGSQAELESDDSLPYASLTFRPTEDLQFKAGWSSTISYPGIIERSESSSFDPETDDPIFGNPNLRISEIENFDLRAEYYFSDEESISIAFFMKDIDDPVERAIPQASGSSADGITFRNAESADLSGVELDVYKNIVDTADYLAFVSGNIAVIDSEVTLDALSLQLEGQNQQGRELQGQSPLLANLQLGLDHIPSEQKFTLLVNYFDDRIFRVSTGPAQGPVFELSRIIVDLNYEKLFSDTFKLKASIKNLLNEEVSRERNGRKIEVYDEGIKFSLSASYEF